MTTTATQLIQTAPIPGLPGIEFGIHPVTQTQYEAVMGTNPSYFKGKDRPVECVSCFDAKEFCKRLSAQTGKTWRLPTVIEWEAAAGGEIPSLENGWFYGNSGEETHSVGQKKPNAFGLYDMHGNVWEWCEDAVHEGYRALRGGSWVNLQMGARAVVRSYDHPAYRNFNIGFRVVCSVCPPSLPDTEAA